MAIFKFHARWKSWFVLVLGGSFTLDLPDVLRCSPPPDASVMRRGHRGASRANSREELACVC